MKQVADPTCGTGSIKQRRVYLFGASGFPNYGDDRIAIGWLQFYREHGYEIIFDCLRPGPMQDWIDRSGNCRIIDSLWQRAFAAGCPNVGSAVEAGEALREDVLDALLRTVDVIHFHGGGYLNSMRPAGAFALGVALACKRRFGTRIAGTGLGLLPLAPADLPVFRKVFGRFDLVEVRDTASFEALRGYCPVVSGSDDFFRSELVHAEPRRDGARRLHLCVQAQWDLADHNWLLEKVAELARTQTFDEIVYYAFSPVSDMAFNRGLTERFRVKTFCHSYSFLMRNHLQAGVDDIALASRFHAHLMLACQRVTGLYACPHEEYYRAKHRSVADIGSGWRPIDPRAPLSSQFEGGGARIDKAALAEAKMQVARSLLELS